MSDLKTLFENPPQGGDGRGVPTQSTMSPTPAAAPMQILGGGAAANAFNPPGGSLHDAFVNGRTASARSKVQSSAVGENDVRNFGRSRTQMQEATDEGRGTVPVSAYDTEQSGEGRGNAAEPFAAGSTSRKPVPTRAVPVPAMRSDGKAVTAVIGNTTEPAPRVMPRNSYVKR